MPMEPVLKVSFMRGSLLEKELKPIVTAAGMKENSMVGNAGAMAFGMVRIKIIMKAVLIAMPIMGLAF